MMTNKMIKCNINSFLIHIYSLKKNISQNCTVLLLELHKHIYFNDVPFHISQNYCSQQSIKF